MYTTSVHMQSSTVLNSNCTFNESDPDAINPRCLGQKTNEPGHVFEGGNGPTTGRCLPNPQNTSKGQCEIRGWCSVELEDSSVT